MDDEQDQNNNSPYLEEAHQLTVPTQKQKDMNHSMKQRSVSPSHKKGIQN